MLPQRFRGDKTLTRLKHSDIKLISSQLKKYDQELQIRTGRTLFGIACHCYGVNEAEIRILAQALSCVVVPITSGEGIISDFSTTVCAILQFLGFPAQVAEKSDTSGIALAYEKDAGAIFMADDFRFVGLNLRTRFVADNAAATGRIFGAALDLMANGLEGKDVLVFGCGPVGTAAIRSLFSYKAKVAVHDPSSSAVASLQKLFQNTQEIVVENDAAVAGKYKYIIDAAPASSIIPDSLIAEDTFIAAPGVPLGVSAKGCEILSDRLIHDKLELGVAAMAVSLLC